LQASDEIEQFLIDILNDQVALQAEQFFAEDVWQQVYRHAERHRVAALIYWQLRKAHPPLPERFLQPFKQFYLATLGRNGIFLTELNRIVTLLTAAGMEVVLLKGAVFLRSLYEDIGLRPMSDLDILLRREAIDQAVDLLKQSGYEAPILHQSEAIQKDVTHDVHLRQSQPPYVDVEVHWLLGSGEKYRQRTDMDWFWQRIIPFEGWAQGVYTLNPGAHLLYICGHLAHQHGLGGLGMLWLYEVACFLKKFEHHIDWADFIAGAKHLAWSAAALYTFREVEMKFIQAPPQWVLEALRQQFAPAEEKHVRSMMVMTPSRVALAWKQIEQLDWAARLRNVGGRLFPSLAFMRSRYGFETDWQALLGYPVRWLDLAQIFLKYLWARAKGKR
jgi:hypothetical protein